MSDQQGPSIKHVVEYAAKLRSDAERITAGDPYANPYRPTEAAARRLCQLKTKVRVLGLPFDADVEAHAEARAQGAEDALQELRWRSGHADRVRREQLMHDNHAHERMARIQRKAREEAATMRRMLTLGQRIDQALAELSVVAAGPTVNWDPKLSGTREYGSPAPTGDLQGKARERVLRLAQQLERDVDRAKVREFAA